MKRIKNLLRKTKTSIVSPRLREYILARAGNLIPALLAVIFAIFLVISSLGHPEMRFLTYLAAGIGIGYSLSALIRMGRHPSGWPTLLVLIFFWAKAILGLIYCVLLLVGLELVIIGTDHVSDNTLIGLLASVSIMQLILGLGLFYGAKHRILTRRVDPGILLRWVFRSNQSGILEGESLE